MGVLHTTASSRRIRISFALLGPGVQLPSFAGCRRGQLFFILQATAYVNEAHTRRPCPAKGMRAPDLACGAVEAVLKDGREIYSGFLLSDLADLSPSSQDALLDNWEAGSAYSEYILTLELRGH